MSYTRGTVAIPNSFDILQAVIEATPDAIFVKDLEGRYVLVNRAAARFVGRTAEDIVGKNDLAIYPEETARRFIDDDRQVLKAGEALAFEGVATSETGRQAYLVTKGVYRDGEGQILGLFGISHDITELRQAHETLDRTREALFRSQKMEAVGQLTGGLAHDFNNILAVILGNLELLRIHVKDDSYARELVDAVLRAAFHGQDLTSDLLAFARRRQLNPEPIDINALIEGVVRLLMRTLGQRIRITTDLQEAARTALVDEAALEAAVLNVAINARDAMPQGGSLHISTSRLPVTREPSGDDDPAPGTYAVVAIQDTGCGMTGDVVARVFEPFFTTKAADGGTGLGLSMVYGFARQSGGSVTIESAPGKGTTVRILLPLAGEDLYPGAHASQPVAGSTVARTILVVEDEPAVRATIKRQLESLGHRALVAETAPEALIRLDEEDDIDLLLTDVVLGTGINGIDLAEAARDARPGLPVVFTSGYAAMPEAQQRILDSGATLLAKPATLSQLARAVNAACG